MVGGQAGWGGLGFMDLGLEFQGLGVLQRTDLRIMKNAGSHPFFSALLQP